MIYYTYSGEQGGGQAVKYGMKTITYTKKS